MADIVTLANAGELGPSATSAPAAAPTASPPAPRPSAAENPRARGYSPALEQREAAAARASGEAPPPATDQQQAPPATGEKFKIGKFETTEDELGTMMQRQAADDQRKLTLPPTPQDYKLELPKDLTLPGGMEYRFDVNDPSLIAARNLAFAKNWSQQDFSEALGIFASHHVQQEAQLAERARAEVAKAGVNATQRMDAVNRWITGMVGEQDAKPIRATVCTAAHLTFYESLMQKLSSQGSASFSQSHRVPPDEKTIPGYDKMTFEQRRFAQDQLAARRR